VVVNRPIFGIEAVVNERATFFASERETDEELRRRIRGSLERAGRSTVDAIRFSLIDDVPQLTDANVALTERPGVPGFVDVRLGIADQADPELVRRVEQSIFNSRPAGVRVRHNLATETPPAVQLPPAEVPVSASPSSIAADFAAIGAPEPTEDVSPAPAEGSEAVVPLQVEVLLRLTERNLAVAETERVADAVRTTVVDYVASVPMGALLVYNKLLGRIVQPDEIADAALLVQAQNGAPGYRTNLDSAGRKFTVTPEQVFVELMEQRVHVDARVLLEARPQEAPSEPTAEAGPPQVTPALRSSLQAAIEGALSAAGQLVRRDDVQAAVGAALAANAPALQFVEREGLVLNAEFEETGRLVDNLAELPLAEHEVAVLRNFTVEMPGVLDG
jgi:hypothetical protein